MRPLLLFLALLAPLAAAPPAGAQLATSSSWPQAGHDPGLTKRTFVTGSQTGTPAPGFPAPLFGGSLNNTGGQGVTTAGAPAVYVDGNVIAGTNEAAPKGSGGTGPVAQLAYVNAADVPSPGAARPLFTDSGPFFGVGGMSGATPAVSNSGIMYVASTSGHMWAVPPSGQATALYAGSGGVDPEAVGSPTLADNGILYFTGGAPAGAPAGNAGALYAYDTSTGQQAWSTPIPIAAPPVALDGANNAYLTSGGLRSFNTVGKSRWTFEPPGPPTTLSAPMVYGSTVYVIVGAGGSSSLAAVSIASGKQLWATRLPGGALANPPGPALGPSGTILALTGSTLTAVNKTSGATAWRSPLPSGTSPGAPPLIDGSGDAYLLLNDNGGYSGTVAAVNAHGQSLWTDAIGTPEPLFGTIGTPTAGAIGLDGTLYVGASDGNVYAFTDPS
jgi:outer membrane protein assembly factor BamB